MIGELDPFLLPSRRFLPSVLQQQQIIFTTERRCIYATHLERLAHGNSRESRRSLGELPDELVEELLGSDLELERVAAVLDQGVEELYRTKETGQSV